MFSLFLVTALFLSGCGINKSILIKGTPFYQKTDDSLDRLVLYLNNACKEKFSKKEIAKIFPERPEKKIDEKSESWHYSHSETKGKLVLKLSHLEKKEIKEAEEMELIFNPEGTLVAYKIKINQPEESIERVGYAYATLQGLIIGGSAGVAFSFMK
ncbi:MAG: hypothetical protein Q7S73_01230 [bacterium]|nr:hypothetical protein [bacterium]